MLTVSSEEKRIHRHEAVSEQLAEAAEICRAALSEPEMTELTNRLPGSPADAQSWFRLLSNYPRAEEAAWIGRMKEAVNPDGAAGLPSVERYAVLQSLTLALPRAGGLPLAVPIKRKFAELATQVARPSEQWRRNFAAGRAQMMEPMAELATLRQFPAGELIFNYNERVSYVWPLRFPPRAVPGFLLEMIFGLRGWGALMLPHINRWRPNPLFLRKIEVERSFWRMAKTLEYRPDVKFLMGDSWLYSTDVSKVSPHLTWLRTIYEEGGAYLVSMESAREDVGFKESSGKRAELYDSGAFNPRRTLAFWRRDDMLSWAARRMDLAEDGECPPSLPATRSFSVRIPSPRPARPAKHNSSLHLWDGLELMSRRPRAYALLVVILPTLVIAALANIALGLPVMAVFALAFLAAWLFQYYFFQ